LWRQGLRQRCEEARRGGDGRALGGEGEGQTRRQADGPPACPQSQVRQGARESRACVSCREVPVRLSQGALSWHRQERSPGVLAVGARKPVSRPQDTCVRLTTRGPPIQHAARSEMVALPRKNVPLSRK